MRHSPISFGTFRISDEDVELAGVTIPAGTMIVANTSAANRDPAVYDDPDRLDITRNGGQVMQTFGGGVHYCLGAHLARLELAEALTIMPRRMPNLRRVGEAPWKPMTALTGPTTLRVAFTPSTP
jgi:cytochrome P450